MLTLGNSFELKEIDWTLFGIVSGILLGVIVLVCAILGINHLILKKQSESEATQSCALTYVKKHLTEIIYASSFIILLVLLFVGKFFITFKVDGVKTTYDVNFFYLIFGGNASLAQKDFSFETNVLMLGGFIALIVGAILSSINFFFKEEKTSLTRTLNVFGLVGVTSFLIIIAYVFNKFFEIYNFSSLFAGEFKGYIDTFSYSSFFIVFLLILLALCNVRRVFASVIYTTQDICEEAILIALAVVLDSFVKFKVQAEGGSIGFAAIPLFIISIRHGAYKGFVASAIMFGLITCMIDGYGFQTYPFDYFIGFGGYCLVGLFFNLFKVFYKNKPHDDNYKNYEFLYSALGVTVGCIAAMAVRYIGSTTSSMVLYGYELVPALVYNSTYIPLTMLINWVAVLLLLKPILMLNKRHKYQAI